MVVVTNYGRYHRALPVWDDVWKSQRLMLGHTDFLSLHLSLSLSLFLLLFLFLFLFLSYSPTHSPSYSPTHSLTHSSAVSRFRQTKEPSRSRVHACVKTCTVVCLFTIAIVGPRPQCRSRKASTLSWQTALRCKPLHKNRKSCPCDGQTRGLI